MAKTYRCPLCGSSLTKTKFEHVTNIQAERAKALHEAHRREEALRRQVKRAKEEGKAAEKRRSERLVQGLQKKLNLAQDRIRQLEKGTTPQTEGLEFEDKLQARLRREFPQDDIKREGRGGDVLHAILVNGKRAGLILYECKRSPRIDRRFIEQALRDRKQRQADFAVLVTTGSRKGFAGLAREGPVLIASPLAVVAVASLLRAQLIELAKAHLTRAQRERIAVALLEYISGAAFKVPLEEAIAKTHRARGLLQDEVKQHVRQWRERWELYQTIDLDVSHIQGSLSRIRDGGKPLSLVRVKPEPLRLPPAVPHR